jgi:hypothetical protein
MQTKIYANYGTLAHEKEVVYGTKPSEIYDELTVDIPDAFETVDGSIAVELSGMTYMLSEALCNANTRGEAGKKDNQPVLRWYDGKQTNTMPLEICEH